MRHELWYVLQDKEEESGGGGVTPPVIPPVVEKPPAEGPTGISRDLLPTDMQNMSEQEIKFTLGRLVSAVTTGNEQLQTVRAELAAAKAIPAAPAEPDPHEGKTLTEVMDEDPEAGIMQVLKNKGLLDRFDQSIDTMSGLVMDGVKSQIADFGEYEEDIKKILVESGVNNPTKDQYVGAYTMAVGSKVISDKAIAARAALTPEIPASGDIEEDKVFEPFKTDLEKEIFGASGLSRERYEKLKDPTEFDVKVPIGGGKFA